MEPVRADSWPQACGKLCPESEAFASLYVVRLTILFSILRRQQWLSAVPSGARVPGPMGPWLVLVFSSLSA